MRVYRFLLILALSLGFVRIGFAQAAEDSGTKTNTFSDATTGFRITKPAEWHFVSNEEVTANRSIPRGKSKEVEDLVRKTRPNRLVVITKYPEPNENFNPTVAVNLNPLGELAGKSAVQVMRASTGRLQAVMKDFAFVEEIQKTKVGGLEAGYCKISYTSVSPKGKEFKPLSRMWVVPHGSYMFMISMVGAREGEDVSEKEFKQMLESIEIE